ncbi:MAG: CRISPR system precrRNA processing endoribonuclease RAMP protein Cas6, partial [Candidatus Methanomethylicaceae archaeon]
KNIKDDPTEVTINFLTPTRIKYNPTGRRGDSILLKQPEFHHIIRRLRDRVSILSKLYCGEQLKVDYDPIVESAKSIKVKDSDLTWHHQTRKSRTMVDSSGQRASQDQSGFTGTISFVGELRQFMPLLLLGQYIHIGEDTTFGSGWYRVDTANIPGHS